MKKETHSNRLLKFHHLLLNICMSRLVHIRNSLLQLIVYQLIKIKPKMIKLFTAELMDRLIFYAHISNK